MSRKSYMVVAFMSIAAVLCSCGASDELDHEEYAI